MSGTPLGGPVSTADSQALFERWRRTQDREARDELISRFLPLARKLARRYAQSSEPYDDLVQVASLGLPQREREILFLRFGEDLTQSEIAERVGVSQMQVSRLLRRSLQRLRQLTGAPHLPRQASAPEDQ